MLLLKKILELLFGEHGVHDLKDYRAVFLVELVNQVDLFKIGLVLNSDLYGLIVKMHHLVNGHAEVPGKAFQFINGNIITVLGGIKLTGLDRLKVTLKLIIVGKPANAFRHNLDLYNSMQSEQLIEKASETLDVSSSELSQTINNLVTPLENYRGEHLESMKPKQPEKRTLSESERKAAITFLKSPNLLQRTKQVIADSGLIGEENNSLVAYLSYTSRKRHTPLHLMCLGARVTGKTWLQEKVSELISEEDKLEITSLSSNAFYFFGREELKHKLLLIEDLDGAESVLYPLRELQRKRKISKTVTLKDNKGNLKTVAEKAEDSRVQ